MGKKCDEAVISRDRGTYAPEFNQLPKQYFIVECYAIAHTHTHVMRLFKPDGGKKRPLADYTEKLQKGCDCEYDSSKVSAEYELIPESLYLTIEYNAHCILFKIRRMRRGSNGDHVPIARSSSSFGILRQRSACAATTATLARAIRLNQPALFCGRLRVCIIVTWNGDRSGTVSWYGITVRDRATGSRFAIS
ncbi:hypothetical protein Tco_0807190 [Tanacetum coccineum]